MKKLRRWTVYFDDFEVQYVKSPVIQMNDYYPFWPDVPETKTRCGILDLCGRSDRG
jgi:hypothetical protein